jgi:hypothetical protein
MLPLIMDTAEGTIAYSVGDKGGQTLHSTLKKSSEPLVVGPLPSRLACEGIPRSIHTGCTICRRIGV